MANTITISNLPQDLGAVNKNFILKYIVTDTDGVSNFTVTQQIDTGVINTTTVSSGAVNIITIDITNLNTGNHSLTITASDGSVSSSFVVGFFVDDVASDYIAKSIRQLQLKINVLNFNFQIVD